MSVDPTPAVLDERIKALDRRIDERFVALDRALKLQAEKDQKHFEDLNHEQARIAGRDVLYLTREVYTADRKDKRAEGLAYFAIALEIIIAAFMWWGRHP